MNILTNAQIAELLTKMVEQGAPDEELANVIEYSKKYISLKKELNDVLLDKDIDGYFDSSTPSIQETVDVILDLIELPNRTITLENVLYFSINLIVFYKELNMEYEIKNIGAYVTKYMEEK